MPLALLAGIAVILVLRMAALAGLYQLIHKAKPEAAEVRTRSQTAKTLDSQSSSESLAKRASAISAGAGAPGTANPASSSPSTPKESNETPRPVSTTPVAATGDPVHDWALEYERTENGPEADLVVRTGDINNLGFGWPKGFDPFSGNSTPPHRFPWDPHPEEPDGTDRLLIGSAVESRVDDKSIGDGYSRILSDCWMKNPCKERQDSMPRPIKISVGNLPAKINSVLLQLFVDDFQAKTFRSYFQVSLNGTRIPSFESSINSLNQTGPTGKLVSMRLLPEYWPLLQSGEVSLLIDDPTTKEKDGYAIDFARILVNPHDFKYAVSLNASVVDDDKNTPIAGATVSAGLETASTDAKGNFSPRETLRALGAEVCFTTSGEPRLCPVLDADN